MQPGDRSNTLQKSAGGIDRLTTDEGGHLVATRFNGPAHEANHIAQDIKLNRGQFKKLENAWAKDLNAGNTVRAKINLEYPKGSQRPSNLSVSCDVNGIARRPQDFSNEAQEMNMFDELSPIYSEIVSRTVASAPADWTRLWLDCECQSGSWSVGGYWERLDTSGVIFFEVPTVVRRLVWEAWKVSGSYNDHWSTANFRVDRPDKLQITFGHEDLDDESTSTIDREDAFRTKTFGDRKIDDSSIDMSGAVSLSPEMLQSHAIGP